jgi:hypothetical protein
VQQHRGVGFLHSGGPFGVVVSAPPFLLRGGLHFGGFSILVWEGGAAVLLRFSVVVECRVLAALLSLSNWTVR